MVAVEHGEQHEHYKHLKKNPTEHKAMEYIIELLVKKDYPALKAMPFDYSKGIFELFRIHKEAIKHAAISIVDRELTSFVTTEAPSIEAFKTQDLFDRYTIILNNLLEIRQLEIHQLEPLVSQSCEHALNIVARLCDQLKEAFYTNSINDSQYAMRVTYMLDLHQAALADVWGSLRLSFLRIAVRRQTVELLRVQKAAEAVSASPHEHNSSCECTEHQE